MSIATEITRLQTAKSNLKTSIENKGVTVPSATLIDGYASLVDQISGGGSPNIQALSVTTNGTYTATDDVDGYSPVTVSVSGSNLVTGTFTGTTEGVMEISIPYSGNGHAKVVVIDLADPNDATYSGTIAKYSTSKFIMTKTYPDSNPNYTGSGAINQGEITSAYKSSTSSSGSMTASLSRKAGFFSSTAPGSTASTVVKMNSKTSIKVRITATSGTTRYGFLNGVTYRYYVIYSS